MKSSNLLLSLCMLLLSINLYGGTKVTGGGIWHTEKSLSNKFNDNFASDTTVDGIWFIGKSSNKNENKTEGNDLVESNEFTAKLKRLGVEQLILKNGEVIQIEN